MVKEQMILDMLTDISERMDKMHVMLESLAGQRTIKIQSPKAIVNDGQISLADVADKTLPEANDNKPIVKARTKYSKNDGSYHVYFRLGDREIYVGKYNDQTMIEQAMKAAEADPERFILRADERAADRAKNKELRVVQARQAEVNKMARELVKKEKEAEAIRRQIQKMAK
jgi:hypothetical protein